MFEGLSGILIGLALEDPGSTPHHYHLGIHSEFSLRLALEDPGERNILRRSVHLPVACF